jgi:GTP-binding protein
MRFIDEVEIQVFSGDGGSGASHFRREKFVAFGGPDGGNGGRGGHVFFEGDENMNTLVNFRGKKNYRAADGGNGHKQRADGAAGEDLIIKVPVGTIIFDREKEMEIGDITEHGQQIRVAEGGRGGLGNAYFKSSTNQAPTHRQEGKPGEELSIKLELKLIADIALIGLPNAGKSTLISSISAAKPKIADYPFTTLEPNLGVVKIDEEKSYVIADIPGLIEDAAEGKGLGHKFLKHIERTKALVHLVDCSMFLEPFEAIEAYSTVKAELLKYDEGLLTYKKELVCITKIDAMTDEEIEKFITVMEEHLDKKVLAISSVSGRNLDTLKSLMLQMLQSEK